MATSQSSYRAGVCNIGRRERRRRYAYAALSFLIAVAFVLGAALDVIPHELVPALFVPLALAIEWYLQASKSFCALLALLGKYSFRESDERGTVSDPDDRAVDRASAVRITAISVVVAALVTAAVFVAL
ncbi:hypothetical protein MBEHAL_0382 [Halarchaeum acidiphilum MH1-52-1]|uniref:Uncharacterized protein n=1 Tax=Halarchaeum acidiphilum MH1-52-1 TaxID=1261545 RepID=U2YS92_9EURY|nr:hypothetical protein [Halarchaeum acidiphilum]GAD51622.1 hypothetical protein MBEHAL_0382 [Halarchaeum acidiphilum MH1-52-1]